MTLDQTSGLFGLEFSVSLVRMCTGNSYPTYAWGWQNILQFTVKELAM